MADRIGKSFLADAEECVGDTHRYAVGLARSKSGDPYCASGYHTLCTLLEGSQQPHGLQKFRPECGNAALGFFMATAHQAGRQIELAVHRTFVIDLVPNCL